MMSSIERKTSSRLMVVEEYERMLYLQMNSRYWKISAKQDQIQSQQRKIWKQTVSKDCCFAFFQLVGKMIINFKLQRSVVLSQNAMPYWSILKSHSDVQQHMTTSQEKCCSNWDYKIRQTVRQLRTIVDRAVYWKRQRWGYLILLYAFVLYRVFRYEYLGLMYIIGLYIIYLIVQYFTPSGLPDPDQDESESTLFLEQSYNILQSSEGDRPVLRALNQFNLWKHLFLIAVGSGFCTCFEIFLIPVYWPFLLIYFLWLIGLAVAKHWKHMKKYGYTFADFQTKKARGFVY